MKKYIVVERYRKHDCFEFINEGTDGLDDIWITTCPYKIKTEEKSKLSPLVFENRSEAIKYKDRQQSYSNHLWSENSHIYKIYGDSKPKWKVEEYNGELFV